jgi:excinuclease ABC subunit A
LEERTEEFKEVGNELESGGPSHITVIGAREHNLKDIDVKIPRHQLVVITGLSGSGKSSLAFDTIYAEGQRRYMETFSAYARQFIGDMERPDVEQIEGLSPVISIEQKTTGRNPRSTVGTVTEIYDFLRLLFARVGDAYSHITGQKMVQYSEKQMLEEISSQFLHKKIIMLAPLIRGRKGHYRELFDQMMRQGYTKVRVDGTLLNLEPGLQVDRYKTHDIELVVDRLTITDSKLERLSNSMVTALKLGNGMLGIADQESDIVFLFSTHLMDAESGISYEAPSPNTFSFNSPYGACPECGGLGTVNKVDLEKVIPDYTKSINQEGIVPLGEVRDNDNFKRIRAISKAYKFNFSTPIKDIPEAGLNAILYGGFSERSDYTKNIGYDGLLKMLKYWYEDSGSEKIRSFAEDFMSVDTCQECQGYRLKKEALHFKIANFHIGHLAESDINDLLNKIEEIEQSLPDRKKIIASEIIKEIKLRIGFLLHVGLDYLNLNRPARTLSGGEAQRIRLATQIGSQLTGITYILDEPSIGLHQRDNQKLIEALRALTEIGNSVLVVEHDKDIMLAADYIIDMGPGAGQFGGAIVAEGPPPSFIQSDSATAEYLNGAKAIQIPDKRRTGNGLFLHLKGSSGHNLKKVDMTIPLGTLTCITGVSGSGKSTLINETLYPILRQYFYKSIKKPLSYETIEGLEHLDKVIEIDQSPIGRTPRSNPATYTGVFTEIRNLFAEIPEAKIRGYKSGRFSFNVKGGRCEECGGSGLRVIEMNFLPDVQVECEKCFGRRYNRETLEVLYKGKSISDVLSMSVAEAVNFFEGIPKIYRKLRTLHEVGLGYITLGQQATTLSGGEAQRVKLAEELSKKDTGNTLYILDEPTTGLHFQDILQLLEVINRLVDKGNTILIIEHNLDVIKMADYIVDMGPEGGHRGGQIVVSGTPEKVAASQKGYTAPFLAKELH